MTLSLALGGTTTRAPQSMQPLWTDSFSCLQKYGFSYASSPMDSGHPELTNLRTRDSTASLSVQCLIIPTSMGDVSMNSSRHTTSAGIGTSAGSWDNGRRLIASAFPIFSPDLYLNVYSYALSARAHRCIRPDAIGGTGLSSRRSPSRGLWSLLITKCLPNKYEWNFFTPHTTDSASFSSCEYCFSAGASVLDAKLMGLSEPSSIRCCNTTPSPYGDASHDSISSFSWS